MPRSSISELLWNKVNVSKPSETSGNPKNFDKWPSDGTQREGGSGMPGGWLCCFQLGTELAYIMFVVTTH